MRSIAQPPETMVMSWPWAATKGHVCVHSPATAGGSVVKSMARVTIKDHMNAHDLGCHWKPCECLRTVMLPGNILIRVGCVATKAMVTSRMTLRGGQGLGHVRIHDPIAPGV